MRGAGRCPLARHLGVCPRGSLLILSHLFGLNTYTVVHMGSRPQGNRKDHTMKTTKSNDQAIDAFVAKTAEAALLCRHVMTRPTRRITTKRIQQVATVQPFNAALQRVRAATDELANAVSYEQVLAQGSAIEQLEKTIAELRRACEDAWAQQDL